jgi:DNA invertase Pin-like site-specific DNA recombinase
MVRYGYMLLDASDPDVGRQAQQLDSIGGFVKIFIDRPGTGTKNQARPPSRQQRSRLLAGLQAGDVIFAASLDRWCDNLRDFRETSQAIEAARCDLCILAEGLDTRNSAGRQILRLLQAFEKLEFRFQSLRKKAGIEAARRKGRRIGRPQVAIPPGFREICREWAAGTINGLEAARRSGLKRTSFYKRAAEMGFTASGRRGMAAEKKVLTARQERRANNIH